MRRFPIALLFIAVQLSLATNCLLAQVTQKFDEQFELWPVDLKISGTIIVSGGGEMPESATDIFNSLTGKDPSVVVLRFEGATDVSSNQAKERFSSKKSVKVLTIQRDQKSLPEEVVASLGKANGVWIVCEGTLSEKQEEIVKQIHVESSKLISRGGVLCVNGLAERLGKFKLESSKQHLTTVAGLDAIPSTIIKTDFEDDRDRNELLSALATNRRCVGIGIEKDTAIVLRGRKIRVYGDGKATFCLMANEQKPLRVQHVGEAGGRRANPYETIVDLTAWRRDATERTVDAFPPEKPPTPFVENGTLVIVGGGGMPRGLMKKFVDLAGGEDARLVYVPCAEEDEIRPPTRMINSWKSLGVKSATYIHTKDRIKANSDEEFLSPLEDATGIWFGGGRQWNLADSYYGTKAHRLMKQVLDRGGVVGGSSAGASIQARYMCRANPVANFDIMAPGYERGLGFIGGTAIDQHFSQRGRQKDMTRLVNRYPQLLGIGLDEGTAIIVKKSTAKVIGRGKVHFYDRNQPVIPGEPDFLALQDGEAFDLAKRKLMD